MQWFLRWLNISSIIKIIFSKISSFQQLIFIMFTDICQYISLTHVEKSQTQHI